MDKKSNSYVDSIASMDADVCEDELKRIIERRTAAGLEAGEPLEDSIGLGLSGGGVRSATFNLGFLQAMRRYNFFQRVDYMSTVSGGGYIGSALSWLMSHDDKRFPFGTTRKDNDNDKPGGNIVAWLRRHGSYLTPGNDGLDKWALIAAFGRGVIINLAIIVPIFFLAMNLAVTSDFKKPEFLTYWNNDILSWVFVAGLSSLAMMVAGYFVYALISNFEFAHKVRNGANALLGRLLKLGVALCALGSVPVVAMYVIGMELDTRGDVSLFSMDSELIASGTGIVALAISWLAKNFSNPIIIKHRDTLVSVGLALLCYGLLVWLYQGAWMMKYTLEPGWVYLLNPGVPISLVLGLVANINHVSMHRFYRDRLLDAYMPKHDSYGEMKNPNMFRLADIGATAAPYQIINTNFITVDSDNPKLRARGSENFIFSPLYCGSKNTRYVPTKQFHNGKLTLATAFTISGAAIDPNTGVTRSRPLALLMALLNIRLGYWIRNPAKPGILSKWFPQLYQRPIWHIYMLREMFGMRMDEKHPYIHLSDGGHFENLGLYELIRRRCKYIIITDAGADPDWTFGDLTNAIEKVRVDFGAKIDIDTQALQPDKETGMSDSPCVPGKINYLNGDTGNLLFFKTTMIPGLSEDIYGYKRVNETFPDQTTADQFFDEPQFEAYRELGFQIGRAAFKGFESGKIEDMFDFVSNGNIKLKQKFTPEIPVLEKSEP